MTPPLTRAFLFPVIWPLRTSAPVEQTPWATYGLIGVNLLLFALACLFPTQTLSLLALHPGEGFAQYLTHAFFHDRSWFGLAHLAINMWFLAVFGPAVESRINPVRMILLYALAGMGGGLLHRLLFGLGGPVLTGASGAVLGTLGAFLILYPFEEVKAFFSLFVLAIPVQFGVIRTMALFFGLLYGALLLMIHLFFMLCRWPLPSEALALPAHLGGLLTGLGLTGLQFGLNAFSRASQQEINIQRSLRESLEEDFIKATAAPSAVKEKEVTVASSMLERHDWLDWPEQAPVFIDEESCGQEALQPAEPAAPPPATSPARSLVEINVELLSSSLESRSPGLHEATKQARPASSAPQSAPRTPGIQPAPTPPPNAQPFSFEDDSEGGLNPAKYFAQEDAPSPRREEKSSRKDSSTGPIIFDLSESHNTKSRAPALRDTSAWPAPAASSHSVILAPGRPVDARRVARLMAPLLEMTLDEALHAVMRRRGILGENLSLDEAHRLALRLTARGQAVCVAAQTPAVTYGEPMEVLSLRQHEDTALWQTFSQALRAPWEDVRLMGAGMVGLAPGAPSRAVLDIFLSSGRWLRLWENLYAFGPAENDQPAFRFRRLAELIVEQANRAIMTRTLEGWLKQPEAIHPPAQFSHESEYNNYLRWYLLAYLAPNHLVEAKEPAWPSQRP